MTGKPERGESSKTRLLAGAAFLTMLRIARRSSYIGWSDFALEASPEFKRLPYFVASIKLLEQAGILRKWSRRAWRVQWK